MTPKPICICENALAVEALKIFNERNIDDLIVVNTKAGAGRLGGFDSQDLPKLKIVAKANRQNRPTIFDFHGRGRQPQRTAVAKLFAKKNRRDFL